MNSFQSFPSVANGNLVLQSPSLLVQGPDSLFNSSLSLYELMSGQVEPWNSFFWNEHTTRNGSTWLRIPLPLWIARPRTWEPNSLNLVIVVPNFLTMKRSLSALPAVRDERPNRIDLFAPLSYPFPSSFSSELKEVTYKRCRECAVLFARMPFERRACFRSE